MFSAVSGSPVADDAVVSADELESSVGSVDSPPLVVSCAVVVSSERDDVVEGSPWAAGSPVSFSATDQKTMRPTSTRTTAAAAIHRARARRVPGWRGGAAGGGVFRSGATGPAAAAGTAPAGGRGSDGVFSVGGGADGGGGGGVGVGSGVPAGKVAVRLRPGAA